MVTAHIAINATMTAMVINPYLEVTNLRNFMFLGYLTVVEKLSRSGDFGR